MNKININALIQILGMAGDVGVIRSNHKKNALPLYWVKDSCLFFPLLRKSLTRYLLSKVILIKKCYLEYGILKIQNVVRRKLSHGQIILVVRL